MHIIQIIVSSYTAGDPTARCPTDRQVVGHHKLKLAHTGTGKSSSSAAGKQKGRGPPEAPDSKNPGATKEEGVVGVVTMCRRQFSF